MYRHTFPLPIHELIAKLEANRRSNFSFGGVNIIDVDFNHKEDDIICEVVDHNGDVFDCKQEDFDAERGGLTVLETYRRVVIHVITLKGEDIGYFKVDNKDAEGASIFLDRKLVITDELVPYWRLLKEFMTMFVETMSAAVESEQQTNTITISEKMLLDILLYIIRKKSVPKPDSNHHFTDRMIYYYTRIFLNEGFSLGELADMFNFEASTAKNTWKPRFDAELPQYKRFHEKLKRHLRTD